MQKVLLPFTLLLISLTLNAQTDDVTTGLGRPWELLLYGDELLVSEVTTDRISKIDLSDPAYPRTTLVSGIDNPLGMARDGDILYVVSRNDSIIYRLSLLDPAPVLSPVIKINEKPLGVAIHGDNMYIGTLLTGKIYRVDLTAGPFMAVDLGFPGLGQPGFMVPHGDYVYFSDINDDVVMRFDATLMSPVLETVATGIDAPAGMFFEGDYLYVNGYLSNAAFQIDVTGGFPAPAVEAHALDNPRGLILYDDEFFSALYVADKVVKGAFSLLPVTWERFTAEPSGNKAVDLAWSVSAMEDHDFFTVERSGDGTRWSALPGAVAAANLFSGAAAGAAGGFWSRDPAPLNGTSYYRIRQTDFDGTATLSEVATVHINRPALSAFPNPVAGDGVLSIPGLSEGATIQIYAADGRLVRQYANQSTFALAGLAPGVYTLVAGEERTKVVVR